MYDFKEFFIKKIEDKFYQEFKDVEIKENFEEIKYYLDKVLERINANKITGSNLRNLKKLLKVSYLDEQVEKFAEYLKRKNVNFCDYRNNSKLLPKLEKLGEEAFDLVYDLYDCSSNVHCAVTYRICNKYSDFETIERMRIYNKYKENFTNKRLLLRICFVIDKEKINDIINFLDSNSWDFAVDLGEYRNDYAKNDLCKHLNCDLSDLLENEFNSMYVNINDLSTSYQVVFDRRKTGLIQNGMVLERVLMLKIFKEHNKEIYEDLVNKYKSQYTIKNKHHSDFDSFLNDNIEDYLKRYCNNKITYTDGYCDVEYCYYEPLLYVLKYKNN